MTDIICECGHKLERHNGSHCTQCVVEGSKWETCTRNFHTVEARYWAKRLLAERDELLAWKNSLIPLEDATPYWDLLKERDTLQRKLEKAREVRYMLENEIGNRERVDFEQLCVDAVEMLAKLDEKLEQING